jgi:hypothetical protein
MYNYNKKFLKEKERGMKKSNGQQHSLKSESEINKYIQSNCSFQFIPIEDFEKTIRLEHFATAIIGPILNTKLKQ